MKPEVIAVLFHCLLVYGIPRPRRLVKRAANLNPGFDLDAFRQNQLDLHNHYRQLHGIALMTKNDTLTQEAQDYAEHLAEIELLQHCPPDTPCNPGGAGENLAFAGGHTSVEINATLVWYEEVYDYNYCTWPQGRATTRPGREGEMVGHFTQIVWTTSVRLGIGYARTVDRTKVYVVGRYSPAGNTNGQYDVKVPKAAYLLDTFQDNCNGINGGFTAWSSPGACSKPCGKGVRFETRSCTNPKPSYNGRDCSGKPRRLHPYWCNSQACTTNVNERDEQCGRRGYTATAHNFGGSSDCTLHCLTSGSSFFARGQVDDGTHCQSGNGACVDGECVLLQDEPQSFTTTRPPATTTKQPSTSTNPPPTTVHITSTTETVTAAPPTTSSVTPSSTSLPPTHPTTVGPGKTTTVGTTTSSPETTTSHIITTTETVTTAPQTTSSVTPSTTAVGVGGYSEWSLPGPCSKSCGGGISFRTRTCIAPQPGGGCIGPSSELHKVWCNPQPCTPPTQERNEQCGTRGYIPEAHNFGGVDECYLFCRGSQSSYSYFYFRGAVDPGTHCNKDTGACVSNVCVPMSYEAGTVIKGKYKQAPSGSYWKDVVFAIPTGATNVQITHHASGTWAVVGFRSSSGFGYSFSSYVKGVTVTYHSNYDITIDGPVNPYGDNQIVVYVIGSTSIQADITFEYTPA